MVHEDNPTDMWYHDTMVQFSIISIDNHLIKDHKHLDDNEECIIYESRGSGSSYRYVPVDLNPNRLTRIDRAIQSVENSLKSTYLMCKEVVIIDSYNHSKGLITDEEHDEWRNWLEKIRGQLKDIGKKYRMFRGHKDFSRDEYDSLVEIVLKLTSSVHELIRDRYTFMRAVDERTRVKQIRKVMGT